MIKGIKWHADSSNKNGLANKLRRKRMIIFEEFLVNNFSSQTNKNKKITILDIGGSYEYWRDINCKYFNNLDITLVNISPLKIPKGMKKVTNIKSINGDGRNLSEIKNLQFDIVFSNSCIEHVGHKQEWKKMADEMKRVGRNYFLQTPNRYFPLEPHFLFPFFQFFPFRLKTFFVYHFKLGFWAKAETKEEAKVIASEINLLSKKDLKELFPDANIKCEKLFGLTKSFMVYK